MMVMLLMMRVMMLLLVAQEAALADQVLDTGFEGVGAGVDVFPVGRAPEGVVIEGGVEGGEPEIEDGEGGGDGGGGGGDGRGGMEVAGEAAGHEDEPDGRFGVEGVGYDAGCGLESVMVLGQCRMRKRGGARGRKGCKEVEGRRFVVIIPGHPLVKHQSSSSIIKHCSHENAPRASPRKASSKSNMLRVCRSDSPRRTACR